MTREDIYRQAIDNYRTAFPKLDPYEIISSRLCMSSKNLRAKVSGERHFTVHEEEQLFIACFFPQGLQLKANFLFHPEEKQAKK